MTGTDGEGRAASLTALRSALGHVLNDAPRPPTRIVVRSGGESIEVAWSDPSGAPGPSPAASDSEPVAVAARAAEPDRPAETAPAGQSSGHLVRAPLVGTLYRAPEPGAAAFVEVGDVVRAGQQVAIIEAMKLMNPIEADRDGRVTAVLVENGQGVEYDQPLLELEPEPDADSDVAR
ncbi:acetyl-CoA carboxylase biotin carboxyl carrier protein [Embleya sp. NPDC050154]|uniref:acetyl-CoA carboxylase biotin carboxyl carrier protein n=1 Tax=Embleya sp. NPDC050154 TaxID=3363988 RepID=UPI0037B9B07B